MVNREVWQELVSEFNGKGVTLVAVSKTKPAADIQELYDLGQRDFGENYVQEVADKQPALPGDIRWHFIGHLQSNKVKYIAPFVHMIHAVDSFKLLQEIGRQAEKHGRVIDVLLQLHIAEEEAKFGMDEKEIFVLLEHYEAQRAGMQHIRICGLMGMATNTDDMAVVRGEFGRLYNFFIHIKTTSFLGRQYFNTCSMGMSADYKVAIAEGSNMVRIGSMLFGARG